RPRNRRALPRVRTSVVMTRIPTSPARTTSRMFISAQLLQQQLRRRRLLQLQRLPPAGGEGGDRPQQGRQLLRRAAVEPRIGALAHPRELLEGPLRQWLVAFLED